MRISRGIAAGALFATGTQGLSFGPGGNEQARLGFDQSQLTSTLKNAADKVMGVFNENVESFVKTVAEAVGQKVDEIPFEAFDSWAELISSFPNAINQVAFKPSKPKANINPVKDWMYIVQSDKVPNHALKVKNPESLGVDNVKQYSGYLQAKEEDKHFFYWFFESRNDPKNDPVILWLNGGPGCSSLTGLFFELGPASINSDAEPVHNPYSWNNNASVIFLDQPVNTGYSYSSGSVSDTVTAGQDVYAFLTLFFKQFPEYKDVKFHIAGESYAGHYIPVFADEILSHEDRDFDLDSVLIGNGLTDPLVQYDYYEPMACGKGGADAVLDETECQGMKDSESRCESLIQSCYNTESSWTCVPATLYCNNAMMGPYQRTGRNVYDIRTDCEPDAGSLCYKALDYIDSFLNKPEVKEAVGAEVDSYQGCNFDTNRNFVFAGDWMKPYHHHVTSLLNNDIPVLIYAGDKDFICNWLGNEAWTRQIEWNGAEKFAQAPVKNWTTEAGAHAGQVTNVDHFTFLRVFGAGHMVPYNQPENALDMVNRWIAGDYAFAN
ncbi:hypothetical protein TRICI_003853 [Trichomonascus ciferrii]|uniref:Carboxypeptidase n=1 Tax=Trichomonascus ciferrii TaxID=44093 RepID=A0A642V7T0_9ASCO|nr:hypothetical protein TRICI_003853 [Trichomonascus ciferrii]